jgi:GNAT superfamily N-acetyltransferase
MFKIDKETDFYNLAKQFPLNNGKGITYQTVNYAENTPMDCLLYYNEGDLLGILFHFPNDFPPFVKGNVNLVVHPKHRRKGIGTMLMDEAKKRWDLKFDSHSFTDDGNYFLYGYVKKKYS